MFLRINLINTKIYYNNEKYKPEYKYNHIRQQVKKKQ